MFSDNSIKNVFKKAGALGVSKKAIKGFKKEIEEYSLIIAKKSIGNARYLGRKIIRIEDVEEAIKEV